MAKFLRSLFDPTAHDEEEIRPDSPKPHAIQPPLLQEQDDQAMLDIQPSKSLSVEDLQSLLRDKDDELNLSRAENRILVTEMETLTKQNLILQKDLSITKAELLQLERIVHNAVLKGMSRSPPASSAF